jgi:curli biogenesis system outer membrane secretion channel CsgG
MNSRQLVLAATCSLLLLGCDKKDGAIKSESAPNSATQPLDVGKVETVTVMAEGEGASAADAVDAALRMAILQVNGTSIDSSSSKVSVTVDISDKNDENSLRANAFANVVKQKFNGIVTSFRVVEINKPMLKGTYTAKIEAGIAKYAAPKEDRIKIVVAPLRFKDSEITVGSERIPSSQISTEIHQKIVDALTNSGRFAVMDREFDREIQQELSRISNGGAPAAEASKLGQAATGDLIWVGNVSHLSYDRHARQLKASGRELVSFSGGWAISQRILNVATRQVTLSTELHGEAPSTEPTTLSTSVDSKKILAYMESELATEVANSIMSTIFPVTIASRDQMNVVLSQGGRAVKAQARYRMVKLGAEIKDPQTGRVLGKSEMPCCEVVIDRVEPSMSYGHLENLAIEIGSITSGSVVLKEEIKQAEKKQGQETISKPSKSVISSEPDATSYQPPKSKDADW